MIAQKQEFEQIQLAAANDLGVSIEANAALKEDYDMLEERFKKHSKMMEEHTKDLEKDQKSLATKCKKL